MGKKNRHAKKNRAVVPAKKEPAILLGSFYADCRNPVDVKMFFITLEEIWARNNCPVHIFAKFRPKAEEWLTFRVPTLKERGVITKLQFSGFGAREDFLPLKNGTVLKQVTTKLWLLKRTKFLDDFSQIMMEAGLAKVQGWTENMECLNELGVWLIFRKGQ